MDARERAVRDPAARITTYRAFAGDAPLAARARSLLRAGAIFALSLRPSSGRRFLRFPFWHHVFDDERAGFAAQLRWLRDRGDLISLDDALALLESPAPLDGRYYCLTFDDGYRNGLTNAAPILAEHGARAAFFVTTGDVGGVQAQRGGAAYVEYLDWDDCRALAAAGMTVGSHTVSHARLASLADDACARELAESKRALERELGAPCVHFCCPWGRPGRDFGARDTELARRLGYRTFLTTRRGSNRERPAPMAITRDHLLAGWGRRQLEYFLSR